MARQKSRDLKITSSVNAPIASQPPKTIRSRRTYHAQSSTESNNSYQEYQRAIYTHDNVREAEENLPRLDSKEGTLFIMKEVLSNAEWQVTYSIQEDNVMWYFTITKKEKHIPQASNEHGREEEIHEEEEECEVNELMTSQRDEMENILQAVEETTFGDKSSISHVKKLLFRRMLVGVSDGRFFLGAFYCMDKQGNIILQDAVEYRNTRRSSPSPMEQRGLGLILIPFACRTSCHVDSSIDEQLALLSLQAQR
ncbi:hypothetical protein L1987_28847 [Smallanthus sonchifolius]|uniref:Uncharacterized protein n=1 Tax=Smallanthus sonchifolius TaxID=185202 RepID=A0ACB9HXR7_9ASTR|nr:hypothetical protein L1987_28847 [Smallanthus sonchifolius]